MTTKLYNAFNFVQPVGAGEEIGGRVGEACWQKIDAAIQGTP